jgi:murein DD-endopeptidase MepM/ murein hydrolase activator NlpD
VEEYARQTASRSIRTLATIIETGASVAIANQAPTTNAPPLRGGRWVAVVGPHRRALQPINGRLRDGQRFAILGQLGNSGNTTGPHLHFQLMTRPSILDTDGLPFVLARFRLDGRAPSLQSFLHADLAGTPVPIDRSVAGEHRHQGFTDLDIVTFPRG